MIQWIDLTPQIIFSQWHLLGACSMTWIMGVITGYIIKSKRQAKPEVEHK